MASSEPKTKASNSHEKKHKNKRKEKGKEDKSKKGHTAAKGVQGNSESNNGGGKGSDTAAGEVKAVWTLKNKMLIKYLTTHHATGDSNGNFKMLVFNDTTIEVNKICTVSA